MAKTVEQAANEYQKAFEMAGEKQTKRLDKAISEYNAAVEAYLAAQNKEGVR